MIDVSEFQARIDWPAVYADGVRRAYIKCGQWYGVSAGHQSTGYNFDNEFVRNLGEARKAGVDVGVYWFASPGRSPLEEARWFSYRVLPLLQDGDLPPALDLETGVEHGWEYLNHWKAAWFAAVDPQIGCRAVFYSYLDFLNHMTLYADRPVWGADLRAGFQPPPTWFVHQYSFSGSVKGIAGHVDLDRFLHDVPRISKGGV